LKKSDFGERDENFFNQIIENISDGCIISDENKNILFVNHRAKQIFSLDDIDHLTVNELFNHPNFKRTAKNIIESSSQSINAIYTDF
jgi:PAS domain S-box-containing protein